MMRILLFVIGTEWIVVLVVAAILLLFGGTKLPQLAKALGQSKKAFREGLDEGEREAANSRGKLDTVDDEALFEEARRRAQQVRSEDAKKIER